MDTGGEQRLISLGLSNIFTQVSPLSSAELFQSEVVVVWDDLAAYTSEAVVWGCLCEGGPAL